jgi:hypothetical protein
MKCERVRIAGAVALFACCCCSASGAPERLPGYLGRGNQPSMAERHPDAPPLPADRAVLEAFAVRIGLVVAPYMDRPGCPKLATMREPYLPPTSCVLLVSLKPQGNAAEGYLVLYDDQSRAYAVESRYEYTGL